MTETRNNKMVEQLPLFDLESDDDTCLATLPLANGDFLHCTCSGHHTTHRFAVDVDL